MLRPSKGGTMTTRTVLLVEVVGSVVLGLVLLAASIQVFGSGL